REKGDRWITLAAIGACAYGLWLLYASGLTHLLMSVLLYAPGLLVFMHARRSQCDRQRMSLLERSGICLLLMATLPAGWFMLH
ncbi:arginine/ornithine antiporter, partial [Edwardsiella piscicida]